MPCRACMFVIEPESWAVGTTAREDRPSRLTIPTDETVQEITLSGCRPGCPRPGDRSPYHVHSDRYDGAARTFAPAPVFRLDIAAGCDMDAQVTLSRTVEIDCHRGCSSPVPEVSTPAFKPQGCRAPPGRLELCFAAGKFAWAEPSIPSNRTCAVGEVTSLQPAFEPFKGSGLSC